MQRCPTCEKFKIVFTLPRPKADIRLNGQSQSEIPARDRVESVESDESKC